MGVEFDWKEMVRKRIDLKGLLVEDILVGVVEKAIDDLVADSSNLYDDMLAAALKPALRKAAVEQIEKLRAKLEDEPQPAA